MFTIKEKIKMENDTREIAAAEYKKLVMLFNPLIGQKIQKQDHTLVKKLKDQIKFDDNYNIEPLRPGGYVTINQFLHCSAYNIYLNIKICYSGGNYENKSDYCEYYDTQVYIADVQKLKMLKTYPHPETTPLDIQEQEEKLKQVKKLEEQLEEAKRNVFYRLRD